MAELREPAAEGRRCPDCESSTLARAVERQSFLHGTKGEAIELEADLPVWRCGACGFAFAGGEAEEIRHEAVCRHFGLLAPREIRAIRKAHRLSQGQLAELTGIGVASIKRWETGALLQNAASDKLLRLLSSDGNVVEKLRAMTAPVPMPQPRFHTSFTVEKQQEALAFRLRVAA